jgi:hypothetical protein
MTTVDESDGAPDDRALLDLPPESYTNAMAFLLEIFLTTPCGWTMLVGLKTAPQVPPRYLYL